MAGVQCNCVRGIHINTCFDLAVLCRPSCRCASYTNPSQVSLQPKLCKYILYLASLVAHKHSKRLDTTATSVLFQSNSFFCTVQFSGVQPLGGLFHDLVSQHLADAPKSCRPTLYNTIHACKLCRACIGVVRSRIITFAAKDVESYSAGWRSLQLLRGSKTAAPNFPLRQRRLKLQMDLLYKFWTVTMAFAQVPIGCMKNSTEKCRNQFSSWYASKSARIIDQPALCNSCRSVHCNANE